MGILRLFLATLVLLSHLGISFWGLNLGVSAVVVFYLLAGRVVVGLWYKMEGEWSSFYKDRFWRIMPAYAASLCFAACVYFAGADSPFLSKAPALTDWISNAVIIPLNYYMYTGQDAFTLLPPAWSLAVEVQFYLLVPLLFLRGWLPFLIIVLSIIVFALAQVGVLNTDVFGYRLLPGIVFIFIVGGFCAFSKTSDRISVAVVWVVAFGYAAYLLGWQDRLPYRHEVALGFAIGVPLLLLIHWLPKCDRFVILQKYAGGISYSVFLLHFPMIWLLQMLFDLPGGWQAAPWVWLGSVLLAFLVYQYIEKPLWRRCRPMLSN